jgi:hypothetical protein
VLLAAAGDHGFDATFPEQAAVFVVVVAAVGDDAVGTSAGSSRLAADRADPVDQR